MPPRKFSLKMIKEARRMKKQGYQSKAIGMYLGMSKGSVDYYVNSGRTTPEAKKKAGLRARKWAKDNPEKVKRSIMRYQRKKRLYIKQLEEKVLKYESEKNSTQEEVKGKNINNSK